MGNLIKFDVKDLPELCVVGKELKINIEKHMKGQNTIPAFWDKCFADGTFAKIEELKDFVYDDAYIGFMADWANGDGYFTYICGMLMKPNCPLPNSDYIARSLSPTTAAIGWIQGTSTQDVCSTAHADTQKALEEAGYNSDHSEWCMELYNCPRFTTPDENGNIILDYYIPCDKK